MGSGQEGRNLTELVLAFSLRDMAAPKSAGKQPLFRAYKELDQVARFMTVAG